MNQTPGTSWEDVAGEWREAGMHLKVFGETLMHAFQTGWDANQADKELNRLSDELRTTGKRLEAALRSARSAAEEERMRSELGDARVASLRAAADSQKILAAGLRKLSETMEQLASRLESEYRGRRNNGDGGSA